MITTATLASRADLSVYTVRHYTRIGLLSPSRRNKNGYKIFKDTDVSTLKFIKSAKSLGFTLKEIRHILDMAESGETPCPTVREIVVRRIKENRLRLKRLKSLQAKMEKAHEEWALMDDSEPTGTSICHLIESLDVD